MDHGFMRPSCSRSQSTWYLGHISAISRHLIRVVGPDRARADRHADLTLALPLLLHPAARLPRGIECYCWICISASISVRSWQPSRAYLGCISGRSRLVEPPELKRAHHVLRRL